MKLRKIPIRRCSNRESLFLGGDRELIMFAGVLAGSLIFSAQTSLSFVFGVSLWVFALASCRLMAKYDPKMRQVYLRHREYQKYYPPRSTPFRENKRHQVKRY